MAKGIEFYISRKDKRKIRPPFLASGQLVVGTDDSGTARLVVAFMNGYYSVSAEEQRRMAENTIALCELLYSQQELAND